MIQVQQTVVACAECSSHAYNVFPGLHSTESPFTCKGTGDKNRHVTAAMPFISHYF